ncbi:unnamed protein product [Cuscuta campestris]|uniref:Uncharacterized protein n=1 Tax=Cuscuta campestris TaxID=132261 RepID=A0A484NKQ0_9ASTE|nr:unnamed protein product [Cuscuta campestris]
METGGFNRGKIKAEDVISKIKDDGDFDRLRLKVVRKVKEDEELRDSLMLAVRQSKALNHPSAKRLKPRQLSDAIYQEVGTKVMSEISDGIWKVIRSMDGMQNEIAETVQSVCNKLLNPNINEEGETSYKAKSQSDEKGLESNGHTTRSEINGKLSDGVPNEPPGSVTPRDGNIREEFISETHCPRDRLGNDNEDDTRARPPGFSKAIDHNQLVDGPDEDLDVPPGFG